MKLMPHLATLIVVLGTVHLTHAGTVGGATLPRGTYQIRATDQTLAPALGQTPEAERWVEFVQHGKVVAREVATVISSADVAIVAKGGRRPARNGSLVQLLKGGEYVRVWMDKDGVNYVINLRTGK